MCPRYNPSNKQESFKIVDSLMVLEVFGDFYWREFS